MSNNIEVEPGAATESVFITSDACDNYEQMSSSLEEIKNSIIYNEENETATTTTATTKDNYDDSNELDLEQNDDYVMNPNWLSKHKHIFVLSSAGKPIYSRQVLHKISGYNFTQNS